MKSLITIYQPTDEAVLDSCSRAGLVLIGGTALEVLAKKYDIKLWRVRSENDFDYLYFSKTGKLPDIIISELANESTIKSRKRQIKPQIHRFVKKIMNYEL